MGIFFNEFELEEDFSEPLLESYYGKNPLLLKCEEDLKILKENFLKTNGNINNSTTEIEDICRNFSTLFGFEKSYLKVVAEERYMNAFTIPYFIKESYAKNNRFFDLERSQYGIKYKDPKGKFLYVYINSYLFRNCSVERIMAVILHEIGHNFFLVKEQITNANLHLGVDNNLAILKFLNSKGWSSESVRYASMYMCEVVNYLDDAQMETLKSMKDKLDNRANDKAVKEYKVSKNIFIKAIKIFKRFIGTFLSNSLGILSFLLFPIAYVNSIRNQNKQLQKKAEREQAYNAEKFSDNFASAYGYALGVAETFNGANSLNEKLYSKIPILRINDELDRTLNNFFNYYSDEHPDSYTRVLDSLNKLKFELNNNKDSLNPSQIAEIEETIKDIETILKKTPLYKKIIRSMFNSMRIGRNTTGNKGISSEEIFDFEDYILADNIKNKDNKKG